MLRKKRHMAGVFHSFSYLIAASLILTIDIPRIVTKFAEYAVSTKHINFKRDHELHGPCRKVLPGS